MVRNFEFENPQDAAVEQAEFARKAFQRRCSEDHSGSNATELRGSSRRFRKEIGGISVLVAAINDRLGCPTRRSMRFRVIKEVACA
jgi:hypothetical protein